MQSRSQEKNVQHSLTLSARGLSPMTPFVDAPDKFRWRWLNLDNARLPSNMSVSDSINLTTLPPMIRAVKAGNIKIMQELIRQGKTGVVKKWTYFCSYALEYECVCVSVCMCVCVCLCTCVLGGGGRGWMGMCKWTGWIWEGSLVCLWTFTWHILVLPMQVQ